MYIEADPLKSSPSFLMQGDEPSIVWIWVHKWAVWRITNWAIRFVSKGGLNKKHHKPSIL